MRCRVCNGEKTAGDFYRHRSMSSGTLTECKDCTRRRSAANRLLRGIRDIWLGMLARCTDPRHDSFANYSSRGISVCRGWSSYDAFAAAMPPRPSRGHSIDRIDNDGGYWCGRCEECVAAGRPMNVRWATQKQQMNNTSRNVLVTSDGVTMTAHQWAESRGVSGHLVTDRLARGWTLSDALSRPVRRYTKTA